MLIEIINFPKWKQYLVYAVLFSISHSGAHISLDIEPNTWILWRKRKTSNRGLVQCFQTSLWNENFAYLPLRTSFVAFRCLSLNKDFRFYVSNTITSCSSFLNSVAVLYCFNCFEKSKDSTYCSQYTPKELEQILSTHSKYLCGNWKGMLGWVVFRGCLKSEKSARILSSLKWENENLYQCMHITFTNKIMQLYYENVILKIEK